MSSPLPSVPAPRAPHRARLLPVLLALLLGAAGAARAVEEGQEAPAFRKAGLDGGQISLAAHRGKVVYLDFWASWCAPCAAALPALDALRQEFPASEFQVLAVNVDRDPTDARTFLARRPVGYPSAFDPEGEIPGRFGVRTMPTSFLIDRQGVVRLVHEGFRKGDVDTLRRHIQELVAAGR